MAYLRKSDSGASVIGVREAGLWLSEGREDAVVSLSQCPDSYACINRYTYCCSRTDCLALKRGSIFTPLTQVSSH